MAINLSLLSQKGGVGKSTLTMMLLNALYHQYGYNVLLIDADFPQNSIYKKRQRELKLTMQDKRLKKIYDTIYQDKEPYPIIRGNLADSPATIQQYQEDYDFIFIDITGTINQTGIIEFFKQIHYFFIPIFQDDLSIVSSMELYSILTTKVQPISTAFKGCKIVFNRVPPKNRVTSIQDQFQGQVDFLEAYVSAYAVYERTYRSTIFPIPARKKESIKFFAFVDCFLKALEQPSTAALSA